MIVVGIDPGLSGAIAILENNQQPDGSVLIPKVLQSYMGGRTRILKT